MANFKQDIVSAVAGESVEAIVIGPWRSSWEPPKGRVPTSKINSVVSWTEAAEWLDYEYDDCFGGEECHPVYIWTPTRVLFVHEYDGATGVSWVPRNPLEIEPRFSGDSEPPTAALV